MNLLFRQRCDELLENLLALSHRRELDTLELQRGLEIQRLRRERRVLRRRVASLQAAYEGAQRRVEAAVEMNERALHRLHEALEEERNPEDDFVTV